MRDIDRTHLENADEAWIAKYRAAVKGTPIQRSRFMRVRVGLTSAHNMVISRIGRILGRGQTQRQRPAPAPEPVPVPGLRTSIGKVNRAESNGTQPPKKATATTKRSRPLRSMNKYHARGEQSDENGDVRALASSYVASIILILADCTCRTADVYSPFGVA